MLNFLKMVKVIIMGGVMKHGHKCRTLKATMINSQIFPLL